MDNPIARSLAGIVGDSHVSAPSGVFERGIDGVEPSVAVTPGSPEEVAEVLHWAAAESKSILVAGSGSTLSLGNVPRGGDVWLSTERLSGVVHYEPADLTATVGAGLRFGELSKRLSEHGQLLPLDPPGAFSRTLGGIMATGRSGPLRMGYGHPRDWVVGLQAVTGKGEVIRSGGRVVKNVAGYDVAKLFIGSLGTLGVITELSIRVRPKPSTEMTIALASAQRAPLWDLARQAREEYVQPVAAEILSPDAARWCGFETSGASASDATVLVIRLAGEDADVRAQVLALEKMAAERRLTVLDLPGDDAPKGMWGRIADLPLADEADLAIRASAAPASLPDLVEDMQRGMANLGERLAWCAGPGTGVLRVLVGAPKLERMTQLVGTLGSLRRTCADAGGSLIVGRAPVEMKERIDVWGPSGSTGRLTKRFKDLFDPRGVLNPGRYVDKL